MNSLLPKATEAELAILCVLWKEGPLTVRKVHEMLGAETGYTTVLKMLQMMAEKGLVLRNESQRAHVYQAKYSEKETQEELLNGFLHKAFRGSTAQLVVQALSSKRATPTELAEIRKLVEQLSKETK